MIDKTAQMIEKAIAGEIRFSRRILRRYSRVLPITEEARTLLEAHRRSWERMIKLTVYYMEYCGYEIE